MSNRLTNLDPKTTTVTIGVVVVIALSVFAAGAWKAHVEAEVEQNSTDIQAVVTELRTQNEKLDKNTESVIRLTATIDAFQRQLTVQAQTPVVNSYIQPVSQEPSRPAPTYVTVNNPKQEAQPQPEPEAQSNFLTSLLRGL